MAAVSRRNSYMVQLLLLYGASIDAIEIKASLRHHPCFVETNCAKRLLVSSHLKPINLH